ncbi:MAG: UxaA family hydrolase [Rhizobiales bacterium]|nr:UxaA family hydrolase [Hyphomicrobiales bacterium]NRB14331.1 UxaA family hydrolase [Hyphomicrobiales bacterium]
MKHTDTTSINLLILNPADNVAILKRAVKEGSSNMIQDEQFIFSKSLDMGHKIAIRPIKIGETILKYGASIGFAAQNIATGEHVHIHNLTSRYTIVENMEATQK